MEVSAFQGCRLLIGAHEAGAGSLLARFCEQWQPATGSTAIVSPWAAPYFRATSIPVVPVEALGSSGVQELITAVNPDYVVVGASKGPTIEKELIRAGHAAGKPVVAFVDHYWNLWQRFADVDTAARWAYIPDQIFVPGSRTAARLIELGAPAENVSTYNHPLQTAARDSVSPELRRAGRAVLNVAESDCVVLFVSEYLFEPSSKWQWEQPEEMDISSLLANALEAANAISGETGRRVVVILKQHPAEPDLWREIYESYPSNLYRVVRDIEKPLLLSAVDLAFGLNSMLLAEASSAGVPSYSSHVSKAGRAAWLSSLHPGIVELSGPGEIRSTIRFWASQH